MELYELKEETERVILVGVATRENEDVQESLDELEELVETAGAQTVGRVVQSREGSIPAIMWVQESWRRSRWQSGH